MKLHLSQNGRETGPFTLAEVRAKLISLEISPTTLARAEGETEWQPVEILLQTLPEDETPPGTPPKVRKGSRARAIACWVVGILVLLLVFSLSFPQYCLITAQANQMKAASNCKQIVGLMLAYGAENCSLYPDSVTDPVTGSVPLTSNEAFRSLFQESLTQEERLFGCPSSRFNPDGNIGAAPTFDQALMTGENHWALTQGQSNTSSSIMPLVFENPVTPSWPPKWNADAAGKPVKGRAWSGGKIIIGKNDGSVETVKLASKKGAAVGPRVFSNGEDMFTQASGGEPLKILNIVVGGATHCGPVAGQPSASNGLPPTPGGLPPLPSGGPLPPPSGN